MSVCECVEDTSECVRKVGGGCSPSVGEGSLASLTELAFMDGETSARARGGVAVFRVRALPCDQKDY